MPSDKTANIQPANIQLPYIYTNQVQVNDGSGGFTGVLLEINSTGHLISNASGTTTITAGAGAGTSPSVVTVTGNDVAGKIDITTGTSPSGSGATVATITFANAYSSTPKAVLLNCSSSTSAAGRAILGTISTTGFTIVQSGSNALVASTAVSWQYLVIG